MDKRAILIEDIFTIAKEIGQQEHSHWQEIVREELSDLGIKTPLAMGEIDSVDLLDLHDRLDQRWYQNRAKVTVQA